jgi:hypothetical protein
MSCLTQRSNRQQKMLYERELGFCERESGRLELKALVKKN